MQYTQDSASSTDHAQVAPSEFADIGIDLRAWHATADKLTIRETGELMRSLVRASAAKRPNREQRMLLAIYTRPSRETEEDAQ